MSAAVVRAWDWGSIVVGRRLPARYPLSMAALTLAVVVAACAGSRPDQLPVTLETVPYLALPDSLTGVKLPIASDGVIAIAGRLPEWVAGQERLSYGGWQAGDQFIAAWGTPNGQVGTPPV